MNIISRRTHGTLDYLVGTVLIASPWLFDFYNGGIQAIIPIVLGLAAIIYSLITDYESGIVSIIPFSTHLILDLASGVILAISPWVFGFSDSVYTPHVVLGMLEVSVVLVTGKPRPGYRAQKLNKPKTTDKRTSHESL